MRSWPTGSNNKLRELGIGLAIRRLLQTSGNSSREVLEAGGKVQWDKESLAGGQVEGRQ